MYCRYSWSGGNPSGRNTPVVPELLAKHSAEAEVEVDSEAGPSHHIPGESSPPDTNIPSHENPSTSSPPGSSPANLESPPKSSPEAESPQGLEDENQDIAGSSEIER